MGKTLTREGVRKLVDELEDAFREFNHVDLNSAAGSECAEEVVRTEKALLAVYDDLRARAAKAEEERDAALAKLHDWRFVRWRELPEFDRKIATDLLNFAGHGEAKAKRHDAGARPFWWALDCLEAITDTLPPPKDPRIEAWRAYPKDARDTMRLYLDSWPHGLGQGAKLAAAALEALAEGGE